MRFGGEVVEVGASVGIVDRGLHARGCGCGGAVPRPGEHSDAVGGREADHDSSGYRGDDDAREDSKSCCIGWHDGVGLAGILDVCIGSRVDYYYLCHNVWSSLLLLYSWCFGCVRWCVGVDVC